MPDQTPHELTDAELLDCVIKLKKRSNEELITKLILHHRPLAFKIAGLISKRHAPSRAEDIRSAAMHGITQGVRWICPGFNRLEDYNITPYLASCCYSFISQFIEYDRVIRVPHSSLKKREDDFDGHAGIPVFLVGQMRDDDGSGEELLASGSEVQLSTAEPEALVKELMGKICKTETERRVLDLRMEGRSQKEIAFLVKLSYQRIAQILLTIKEAYIYQKEGVA